MMPKLRRAAMESEICSAAAALVFFVTSLTVAFSQKTKKKSTRWLPESWGRPAWGHPIRLANLLRQIPHRAAEGSLDMQARVS